MVLSVDKKSSSLDRGLYDINLETNSNAQDLVGAAIL